MERLESLNDIAAALELKPFTLAIFGLEELYDMGKSLERLSQRPVAPPCSSAYDLVFDLGNKSFCSIFSDAPEGIESQNVNGALPEADLDPKLVSDSEILSSEFECDNPQPILTSESRRLDEAHKLEHSS